MQKWIWMRVVFAVCMLAVGICFAGIYEDTLEAMEQWISKRYEQGSRAWKSAERKLACIDEDEAESEEEKVAALKKEFPEAFQVAPKEEKSLIFMRVGTGIRIGATQSGKLLCQRRRHGARLCRICEVVL